jgi:succinate dehydrogenase / fumarate reductase, membrane anchor subunit
VSTIDPLARARGRGSAGDGVHHWFAQRSSAALLVLLAAWLLYAAIALAGADFATTRAFLAQPFNAALMILLLVSLFYHAMLGLQVVIEDYVHQATMAMALHFLTRAGAFLGMALGAVHVIRIALGA